MAEELTEAGGGEGAVPSPSPDEAKAALRARIAKLRAVMGLVHEANERAAKAPREDVARVKRMNLGMFTRDYSQEKALIEGRWLERGGIAMIVSTTGSGKSVLQTQLAISFSKGKACCGLVPTKPLKSWIIQSEDSEDRVAFDRDEVLAHLEEEYPDECWQDVPPLVKFLDFTGLTGPEFIETLENELREDKPDVIFINPFNAYFGGNLKEGADVSAFFKGGKMRGEKTYGLEAVLKAHQVGAILFGHTGKPPTVSEQRAWLKDPFSAYKMCGASEIVDAVRSVVTFLPCAKKEGVYIFSAGKNGRGLGWTDAEGRATLKSVWRWGKGGHHCWCAVPKEYWKRLMEDER